MLFGIFLPILILQAFTAEKIDHCIKYDGDSCVECENTNSIPYGVDTNKNSETYGQCIQCQIPKCSGCKENAYKCDTCSSYYKIDTDSNSKTYNKCVSCPNHCNDCSNAELGECTRCSSYSALNKKKQCDLLPESKVPNCKYDVNGKCKACKDEYGPDINGKCIPCNDNGCQDCYNNPNYCRKCKETHYLSYGSIKCHECGSLIPNCKICQAAFCHECNSGYTLYSGKCYSKPCIEHCELCENDTECFMCELGYGFNKTGHCVPCSENNCADCRRDYLSCFRCDIGYSLHFSACEAYDSPHCVEITNSICKECEEGYSLDISTEIYKCVKSVVPNCETYSNGKCYSCKKGYSVDVETNECKHECKEHCRCPYRTTCDFCEVGYKKSGTKCVPLSIEGCAELDSNGVCVRCISGYYFKESEHKCYKCSIDDCINCNAGVDICTECESGYGLDLERGSSNYGKCNKCTIPNCIKCDDHADKCVSCKLNYELSFDNKCIKKSSADDDDDDDNGNNSTEDDKNGLPTGAIIGIVVGCIVVVGVVIFLLVFFLVIRKRKNDHSTSEAHEE